MSTTTANDDRPRGATPIVENGNNVLLDIKNPVSYTHLDVYKRQQVFNWPGIGQLYARAIGAFDTPVIVANVVIYAYLLALTVFLLDFIYALVDPRVRVGGGGPKQ